MATDKKTPEVETVTMLDGRIVDFPGKTRMLKSASFDELQLSVRMDFRNGETRLFSAFHNQPNVDTTSAKFAITAMGHGLEQKLGDVTSGITDIDDAIEAVDTLMDRLNKGEWNLSAGSGGASMAGASILARALVEVSGQTITAVREMLGGLDAKTKNALRLDPEIAPVIKKLEAERAARAEARGKSAPKVDTSSVLANLKAGVKPAAELAAAVGA